MNEYEFAKIGERREKERRDLPELSTTMRGLSHGDHIIPDIEPIAELLILSSIRQSQFNEKNDLSRPEMHHLLFSTLHFQTLGYMPVHHPSAS